jgi:hypothetical protein
MFGLSENNDKNDSNASANGANNSVSPTVNGGAMPNPSPLSPPSSSPSTPPPTAASDPDLAAASAELEAASKDSGAPQDSAASINDVNLGNAYIANDPLNAKPADDSASAKPSAASLLNNIPEDNLIKLKQQALQNLAPLVDHLDQSAEEKFKTTMMLIQASDNAELIQDAYDAANKIQDEKVRARALLDVVNEINYFTQHQNSSSQPPTE